MKSECVVGAVFAVLVSFGAVAFADVLTFDDAVPGPGSNSGSVPDGYGGLLWDRVVAWDVLSENPIDGARSCLVSGDCIAFAGPGVLASFSAPVGFSFDLDGTYMNAFGKNGVSTTIHGYRGDLAVYSRAFTLDTTGPHWRALNFENVDRVTLRGSRTTGPGGSWCLDNLTLTVLSRPSAVPGDCNRDGFVDDADLAILLGNWTGPFGTGRTWGTGDFEDDGDVADDDLSMLLSNWTGPPPAGATIPEPATLFLLALGGLAVMRRRRRGSTGGER